MHLPLTCLAAAVVAAWLPASDGFAVGPTARRRTGRLAQRRHRPRSLPPLRMTSGDESDLKRALEKANEDLSNASPAMQEVATSGAADDYDASAQMLAELSEEKPYAAFLANQALDLLDRAWLGATRVPTAAEALAELEAPAGKAREKVVVLGSGWGAASFLKAVDCDRYDVTVVSPRNYFLFTPMLAGASVGTVEHRSITEPIRAVQPRAQFVEATAVGIGVGGNKVVECQSVVCEGTTCTITDVDVPYDHCVVAVGSTAQTFGIKGVREHCQFLRSVDDAVGLRRSIGSCFERASLPGATEAERRTALSFVVVGAGPIGIEFAAELQDYLEQDASRYYADIIKFVSITIVEATDKVLAAFDAELQNEALLSLKQRDLVLREQGLIPRDKQVLDMRLSSGVKEVNATHVMLPDDAIAFGLCVWATGNGPLPLVLNTIDAVPDQVEAQTRPFCRGRLSIDGWCRAAGADGLYAIGDCAVNSEAPLPPTAQVAGQQGEYLGRLLSSAGDLAGVVPVRGRSRAGPTPSERVDGVFAPKTAKYERPFQYNNLGILAYVGGARALAELSIGGENGKKVKISGSYGFALWRSVYLGKQVSMRNRLALLLDWVKVRAYGRDIARL